MAHAVADIDPADRRAPLIEGAPTFHTITDAVSTPTEWTPPFGWYVDQDEKDPTRSLFQFEPRYQFG